MKLNKKATLLGFIDNIQFIFILIIVLALIIGLIYGLAVAGPLIAGETSNAADMVKLSIQTSDNNSAISNATTVSADVVTGVMGKMELLVYSIFFGLFIGFLIVAYEVKFYPFLSFAWLMLMIIVVLFAMILSDAYEIQKNETTTDELYSTWGSTGWLIDYLPQITSTLGLISTVLLFMLRNRSPDEEISTGSINI